MPWRKNFLIFVYSNIVCSFTGCPWMFFLIIYRFYTRWSSKTFRTAYCRIQFRFISPKRTWTVIFLVEMLYQFNKSQPKGSFCRDNVWGWPVKVKELRHIYQKGTHGSHSNYDEKAPKAIHTETRRIWRDFSTTSIYACSLTCKVFPHNCSHLIFILSDIQDCSWNVRY